jgi:hypothetical protein
MSEPGAEDSEGDEVWEEVILHEEDHEESSPPKPIEVTLQSAFPESSKKKKNTEKFIQPICE